MNQSRLNTVRQLRAFLHGALAAQFCALSSHTRRNPFFSTVLKGFGYAHPGHQSQGEVN